MTSEQARFPCKISKKQIIMTKIRQVTFIVLRRFAQWLGRRGIEKTSAKITLMAFASISLLTCLVVLIATKDFGNTTAGAYMVNVLADVFVTLLVAILGIAAWYATSYYKEEEFTLHIFSYEPTSTKLRDARRWLAFEINEDFHLNEDDKFVSMCIIDQRDEVIIDKQIAAELLSRNTASIAILPFSEMAQGMLEICRDPESTHNSLWTKRKEVEVGRTFALFVTYDPQIESSEPELKSLRFFSTPLIDTAAIVSDIIRHRQISRLVLLSDEPGGSFQGIERALQSFVRDKIDRVDRIEPRIAGMVRTVPGDYVPGNDEKVAVFVLTVDPSIALLEKLKDLESAIESKSGKIVAIYVLPTWFRNWRLADTVSLISHWDVYLKDRKLMTVLPEGLADYVSNRTQDDAFDIISFYTQGAFNFAHRIRQSAIGQGGAAYNKIGQTLQSIAHRLVRESADNAEFSFQRIFSTGEIYYDPIIVSFRPNAAKKDFEIGTRTEDLV